MKPILIINIKELIQVQTKPVVKVAGKDMQELKTIKDAYLLIEKGFIKDFGKMKDLTMELYSSSLYKIIDATDKFVFPSFCDSHTHLVYAGSREIEYIDKINVNGISCICRIYCRLRRFTSEIS